MPNFRERISNFFNNLIKRNNPKMLSNVSKENYEKYKSTYDTLFKIFEKLENTDTYLIGGISAAIQTNRDLYRQNGDLDIMCKDSDLPRLMETLKELKYNITDKRGIKTENKVDKNGKFIPMDHELNANTKSKKMLGVGIFTYETNGKDVITHSYAYFEKEECVIGTEKVMSKELFDLMYNREKVNYKGVNVKSQSKEYIYLTKIRGIREKDHQDAEIVKSTLDANSQNKIKRIQELEAETISYILKYDEKGKVTSRTRIPTMKEKAFSYLDKLYRESSTKTPEQVAQNVIESDNYKKIRSEHPEIDVLINKWQEKSKDYTYKDKVGMIIKSYSNQLNQFDKNTINQALLFLSQRKINHGEAKENDIVLNYKSKEIFKLMNKMRTRY